MNNGFYIEVYKHRKLIMYNVLQVYRIMYYPKCITIFHCRPLGMINLNCRPLGIIILHCRPIDIVMLHCRPLGIVMLHYRPLAMVI